MHGFDSSFSFEKRVFIDNELRYTSWQKEKNVILHLLSTSAAARVSNFALRFPAVAGLYATAGLWLHARVFLVSSFVSLSSAVGWFSLRFEAVSDLAISVDLDASSGWWRC